MTSAFLKRQLGDVAAGHKKADLVIKNGLVPNVFTGEILKSDVAVAHGYICGLGSYSGERTIDAGGCYVCPGLIDAHYNIQSALATPREVIRQALRAGNTAFIADMHDIANVLGPEGLGYMLFETENAPFNAYFAAPPEVPAARGEGAGRSVSLHDIRQLACMPRIASLGDVCADAGQLEKLEAFGGKPVSGDLTALDKKQICALLAAGVSVCACDSAQQALELLRLGAYVRTGGSAGRVRQILEGLTKLGAPLERVMLASYDRAIGAIHDYGLTLSLLRAAVRAKIPPVTALAMATINTANAFGLRDIGAVAPGRYADIVIFDNLRDLRVQRVIFRGETVSEKGSLPDVCPLNGLPSLKRTVNMRYVLPEDIALDAGKRLRFLDIAPGGDTKLRMAALPEKDGMFIQTEEFAKLCVFDRYNASGRAGVCAVRGFGMKSGCIASSVSHDIHNVTAVCANDADLPPAIDAIAGMGGGLAVVSGGRVLASMPLPVAGLMSDRPFDEIDRDHRAVFAAAAELCKAAGFQPFEMLWRLTNPAAGEAYLTCAGFCDNRTRGRKRDA